MRFVNSSTPNRLTILRILLVPIIIIFICVPFGPKYYYAYPGTQNDLPTQVGLNWILAGVLFVIACITDFLDGYLSRKYNWISDFGKLWDPIADKLLINTVLILFAGANPTGSMQVYFIIPIIMICRDLIVDASRMNAASKGIVIPADGWGKWKTTTQMIGILVIFFVCPHNLHDHPVGSLHSPVFYFLVQNLFMWIALVLSVYSGVNYVVEIGKQVRAVKNVSK